MRILPCGERALLVELADEPARRDYFAALLAVELAEVAELVPAARTVLVVAHVTAALDRLAAALAAISPAPGPGRAPTVRPPLTVPVRYDGADLAEVAELLGMTPSQLIRRHAGQTWRVDFIGFAPGFGYLTGTSGGLEVPRRSSPRPRIPAGSVGLAGRYTGVYPRASPGGWQLIGRTELRTWDPTRAEPALLVPGATVRFRPVE